MSHDVEAPPEVPEAGLGPPTVRKTSRTARWLSVSLLAALIAFIGVQAHALWVEWRSLGYEQESARLTTVVGYQDINRNPSYAECPDNWMHDEGQFTLLWAGWKPGVGHGWFRVGKGEIDHGRISGPMGRDVIQAIDRPVLEVGGGPRWHRIPWDAPVVGMVLERVPCVYPLLVLQNVEVINDEVAKRPVLVTYCPQVRDQDSVYVFDPVVEGDRLTLGLSGYLHDERPLLYDRKTESLWQLGDGSVTAIAGHYKGKQLRRILKPELFTWSAWRSRYPESRLVVGADRSGGLPTQ